MAKSAPTVSVRDATAVIASAAALSDADRSTGHLFLFVTISASLLLLHQQCANVINASSKYIIYFYCHYCSCTISNTTTVAITGIDFTTVPTLPKMKSKRVLKLLLYHLIKLVNFFRSINMVKRFDILQAVLPFRLR